MNNLSNEELRKSVRKNYGKIANSGQSGCGCAPSSCCGDEVIPQVQLEDRSLEMGYSQKEVDSIPAESALGLGCGNPTAIASLKEGETVLDLGSGAGIDCFLAANQVGPTGKVIGVDMTAEMISKARENATKNGFANVEFRLSEIEHLPVADNSVDIIISNCVINLSPDKQQVFNDAFRVLKNGGRLTVSDIVATKPIPENLKNDLDLYTGCVSGAALIEDTKNMLLKAGFEEVVIEPQEKSRELIKNWSQRKDISDYIVSAAITAKKLR